MTRRVAFASALAVVLLAPHPHAQQAALSADRIAGTAAATALVLAPTNHPRLPLNAAHLWLAPDGGRVTRPSGPLSGALELFDKGNDTQALAGLSQASVQEGVLGSYALYYAGRAQQRLGKATDALRTYRLIQQRGPVGYLREAAAIGEAETLEATGDHAAAAAIYERLSTGHPVALDDILMRLGREAEAADDATRAVEAYARVYYEFPLNEFAAQARDKLDAAPNFQRIGPGTQRYKLELGRAQRLFGAKQYAPAKSAFEAIRASASGDEKAVVELRMAEADFYLKRYRQARDAVAPHTAEGAHRAEAMYFQAVASRALGDNAAYLRNVRQIVDLFPDQPWAPEALNHLATQYVRQDDDDAADTVFREIVQRYPQSSFAERAAWKVGWRSFRQGRYGETAQLFERAAADFPRSDYRPSWLFWAGRAHEENRSPELAEARFILTATDYLNSYYGRLAVSRLRGKVPPPRVIAATSGPVAAPPPNDQVVRALLEMGRFEDALNELKFAQRNGSDSPQVQATIAWVLRQQGLTASGREQFNLLRGSITAMRRAYPQFMAAGGEYLPREVLSIIFPVSYWDLIQKYAAANDLDPYLVAALVAQESTFVPDIRSSANAVGLMQLIPSTARAYARKLGLRYSASLMAQPEANIRMGTAYLADKVREFGDLHLVLAAYNAGERAVRRWQAERPGVPTDQFIDDIPYPETQNYVKRILGTADDYRRLYGNATLPALSEAGEIPAATFAAVTPTASLVGDGDVQRVTAATPVMPAKPAKVVRPARAAGSTKTTPAKRRAAPTAAKPSTRRK